MRLVHQAVAVLAVLLLSSPGAAQAPADAVPKPQQILEQRCGPCHRKLPGGGYFRISQIRETPEGWDMTIDRMRVVHHVSIPPGEQAALVKYLADSQGLAPEEAAPCRFVIEKRPNYIEQPPNERLGLVCGSCHSFARAALERRDSSEWLKLVNFHVAQFPSLEYQSRLRSIEWWKVASTETAPDLGKRFPFETAAWKQWRRHRTGDLSGDWCVTGHEPGAGDYHGSLSVSKTGDDQYSARWTLKFKDGKTLSGEGAALLYTGYEWRASATLDGKPVRQVLAVSPDGESMTGRWFYRDTDEQGGEMSAVRIKSGVSRVLAVEPSSLKAGAKTQLAIVGINLSGEVRLGNGIKVVETLSSGPAETVVVAQADADAADGPRDVSAGAAAGKSLLVVYHKLDSARVEPDYAIARVGGNGGPIPPVTAQFEAVGYLNGPDGKPGTADDVRVGVVPAQWSMSPFDDTAAQLQDEKFAGRIDQNGLFTPAGAGPNPMRRFGTNNTGNLKVLAAVEGEPQPLRATGHLVVTVQRWVDPPLR